MRAAGCSIIATPFNRELTARLNRDHSPSLEDVMQRTLCLAVTMLAMAAGTAAADQGRASGSPIGGEHKGVIAGRVTDASAQSVPGVFVTLMRRTTSRGVTRVHPVAVRFGATTNAKGEYSLERLASGPYYVVALPRDIPRNVRIASDSQAYRFGHGITYHPAASRSSDAKVVNVGAGAAAIADITLAPAHLAEVSGTAIGSDGKPAKGGGLLVAHATGCSASTQSPCRSALTARS